MKIKINKKLNESLLEELFTVVIPLKVKVRTDSSEEENLLIDLNSEISNEVIENVDYQLNKNLYPYLQDNKSNIEKQLDIKNESKILHIDVNLEPYKRIPIMSGTAFFDVEIDKPVDDGEVKRIFNTLINNNSIYEEFTFTMEDDYYGMFDFIVEIEKSGEIEIESY